ncbi:MAG: hypothetical protein QXU67_05430, partial [Candidatus Bathyarchaeia archaeon]
MLPDLLILWNTTIRHAYGRGERKPEQIYPLFQMRVQQEIVLMLRVVRISLKAQILCMKKIK